MQQSDRWRPGLALSLTVVLWAAGLSVATAQGIKHPVLKYDLAQDPAAWERSTASVMAMSEEQMLSFVPDRPFVRFCECPNCFGGSQGDSVFTWTIDRPDELKCRYCGMVFPNSQYPEDKTMSGKNALGETFTYPYHQDTKKGFQCFFSGQIMMYKRNWIMGKARLLAAAWQATKKPEYARRAVLILDRVATTYPHYPVVRQNIALFDIAASQKPPYPGAGGKWGRWAWDELPAGVPETYDLVYASDEFDKLSKVRGVDVRARFEKDFLRATFEYINTFPRHDNNMAPFYLDTAAKIGRVIGEPHYVHWAYYWLLEILNGGCCVDGMWAEAPSYHYQVMGGLKSAFDALRGYTDPPGYTDPLTHRRFDNLNPDTDIAFFAKAQNAPATVAFPSGICPCIHDTWPGTRTSAPRSATVSTCLPGYGHASLGRGNGADQMQAQLHFSGGHGHEHLDNLNLTLFAKGRELLSDLGYTHTALRAWNISTAGHNTVVIDRKSQNGRNSDGDLLSFFPDTAGVSVAEADGARAYAAVKDLGRYRRLLVTIPVSESDAYVVDVFRVQGGATHDWMLHGSADEPMTASCNVALQPHATENLLEAGEKWVEPRNENASFSPYGVIRQVQEGHITRPLVADFRCTEGRSGGVRVHLPTAAGSDLYLGQSPSVRQAKADDRKVYDAWMPQLILRHRGDAPLATTFAAVEEPYGERPFIGEVNALDVQPAAPGVVALQVKHGQVVDTIISTPDEAPYDVTRTTSDGISLQGRLAIVRRAEGKIIGAWLFEGKRVAGQGWSIVAEAPCYEGQIIAASRKADGQVYDALVSDRRAPLGDTLRGSWMIVTHGNGLRHGYEIDQVQALKGDEAFVLKDDHGLRIQADKTTEVYAPRREMTGPNTYRAPTSVAFSRRPDGLYQLHATCPVEVTFPK